MAKKKLDVYKGRLTPAQATVGMNAAIRNMKRLTDDARLLLEQGRYPSASSLAILAIEEAGKISIVRGLVLATDDKEVGEKWREYRSHTKKNVMWLLPKLVSQGARTLDEMSPLFDPDAEHPYLLDQLKQLGFYSDCLGNGNWMQPADAVNEEAATHMVRVAEAFSVIGEVTELEIELWVRHLQPVWHTSGMRQAIVDWRKDMVAHGLASDVSETERFVFGSTA